MNEGDDSLKYNEIDSELPLARLLSTDLGTVMIGSPAES